MSIDICVQTMRGYADTLALARWCEAEGVPALAVADHYLSGPDQSSEGFEQLVILGGIARETTSLELSTLVSPLTFRHPAVHLKAGVTLDHMTGGRFSLGIGTGWMESEHESFGLELYPLRERFDRLEETLQYIHAGLGGAGTGFEGAYYRLAAFDPRPAPANLRIVVGGGGATRTPTLAGRFADEFNAFPSATPMDRRVETCRAAARETGRDPTAIRISTAFPAAVAADPATMEALIARRAARAGVEPGAMTTRFEGIGIPVGTPESAAAAYATLAAAGVTRVYLQMSSNTLDQVAHAVDAARRAVSIAA